MPLDFERVPPRLAVPSSPKVSVLIWLLILVMLIVAGLFITFFFEPLTQASNTLWFWICAVIYPFLTWIFIFSSWMASAHIHRNQVLAVNRVSDDIEQSYHAIAKQPLAIIGYAWRISSDAWENSLDALLEGKRLIKTRPSAAIPDVDVNARWFEIPGMPFYPGNVLNEYDRHLAVFRWVAERLMDQLAPQVSSLSPGGTLKVELRHESKLEDQVAADLLTDVIKQRFPTMEWDLELIQQEHGLFRVDTWFDESKVKTVQLLVSIVLRDAISTVLQDSVSEAGAAILVAQMESDVSYRYPDLVLHRPARGNLDSAALPIEVAAHWGQSSPERLQSIWTNGLSSESLSRIRGLSVLNEKTTFHSIEELLGHYGMTGAWLEATFAAATARSDGNAQFVLSGEEADLIALVCRRQG